jgi:histidinol-phosphatase
MPEPIFDSLLTFALDAAWQAGRITLGYFQTALDVESKKDASPVTRADREAEERIRALIDRFWPDHGIVGEEGGERKARSAYTWIIDPIDGTKSFISGVPLYGCLVALAHNGEPVVGVAHFPALNETLYASRGGGCYLNGRRVRVSSVSSLSNAVLLGSEVTFGEKAQAAWERLCAATRIQRTWGDAYGYMLVATGRAELMLDPRMNLWDNAPFGVILPEAGGTFTDWRGRATIHAERTIATNGILLGRALALLADR